MLDKLRAFELILDNHGVSHAYDNGRLMAEEVYTYYDSTGTIQTGNEWIDISEFTKKDLYFWLGY